MSIEYLLVLVLVLYLNSAKKRRSGFANECPRIRVSGDDDVELELLMLGAQKLQLHLYPGTGLQIKEKK